MYLWYYYENGPTYSWSFKYSLKVFSNNSGDYVLIIPAPLIENDRLGERIISSINGKGILKSSVENTVYGIGINLTCRGNVNASINVGESKVHTYLDPVREKYVISDFSKEYFVYNTTLLTEIVRNQSSFRSYGKARVFYSGDATIPAQFEMHIWSGDSIQYSKHSSSGGLSVKIDIPLQNLSCGWNMLNMTHDYFPGT